MSSFEYRATQPDGHEVAGRIQAANADEARRLLAAQGLTVRDLTRSAEPLSAGASAAGSQRPLSASESEQVAGHLARFGLTGLPLEEGLRAGAAETASPRVANALNHLATQLGQGASLEAAIGQTECPLPRHIGGLIAVAARTGQLGSALAELVEHQHAARVLRREVRRGLAYPLFVAGVALTLILVIMFGISGVFQEMFDDFGLELPGLTKLVFWWRDTGIWILFTAAGLGVVATLVIRKLVGPAVWLRLISTMPVFGRMSYWLGLAEWTGLLSVLVQHDVPLSEALRLSAAGVRNAYIGDIANALAMATENGKSFSDAMSENHKVPASLVPVIRWGEHLGSLGEALSTTRELLERRVRVRALMLRVVLPPLIFIMIACQVGALVIALFMPLVSLIQGLS